MKKTDDKTLESFLRTIPTKGPYGESFIPVTWNFSKQGPSIENVVLWPRTGSERPKGQAVTKQSCTSLAYILSGGEGVDSITPYPGGQPVRPTKQPETLSNSSCSAPVEVSEQALSLARQYLEQHLSREFLKQLTQYGSATLVVEPRFSALKVISKAEMVLKEPKSTESGSMKSRHWISTASA